MDDQNELTISIMNVLKDICTKSPVYRNERGTKAGKGSVVLGTKEVKELFPQELCKYTFLHNKGWIRGFEEDSREELFLTDVVGITKYNKNTFLKRLFDEAYYDDLDELFAMQNDKWLRKFFVFCMDDSLDDDAKKAVKDGLRKVRCIRTARNKMVFPREATLPLEDKTTFRKRNIIKNTIVYPGGKPYECTDGLLAFLANVLCMNKYSEKSEMIQLAEEMSFKKQTIDKKYMSKLLILADYHIHSKDNIYFSGYPIFPVETNRGMKRLIASEIVIGKPFFKDGDLLAKALNRPCLWNGIRKLMKPDEVDRIITFALDCGAYGKPKIMLQPAWNHPDFKKFLNVDGGRGGIDSNFDFTIPELDTILKRKSLRLNKLIWECITSIPAAYAVPYLSAEYSVNSRQIVNRCSSSLIYYLSKRTWVPDKNNKLFAPGNIDIKDISDEFVFDKNNPILKALKFGSLIVDKEAEIERIKKEARKFGLEVVSKEEYQEFMAWKG